MPFPKEKLNIVIAHTRHLAESRVKIYKNKDGASGCSNSQATFARQLMGKECIFLSYLLKLFPESSGTMTIRNKSCPLS